MATTQKRGHDMGSIVKGKNGVLRFYWTDAKEKVWQSHFFTWEGEGDSESGSAARQAQFAGEQKAPAGQCRTGAGGLGFIMKELSYASYCRGRTGEKDADQSEIYANGLNGNALICDLLMRTVNSINQAQHKAAISSVLNSLCARPNPHSQT